MEELRVSRVMAAPPERAWRELATYARWTGWGLSISAVDAPGEVVRRGDEGRVKTKLGLWVPFVITEVEEGRAWRWSVAGVDATGHLVEAHPHGCRVTFTAPRWALPYELVLRPSLAALSRRLG